MNVTALKNKRVLVAGLGVTGLSVVKYLNRSGIEFEVADESSNKQALASSDVSVVFHQKFSASLFSGFDVIVLSPGVPRAHPAIVAALDAGVSVIGDIELFAAAVEVPVIAVTGTNGKSTVVAWLTFALNECGIRTEACGNIGLPALDCLSSKADVLVLELSSFQLESTLSLRPLCAAVLNVSDDHLDRYESMEHYATVKRHVYSKAQYCVANFDDKLTWPVGIDHGPCTYTTLNAGPECGLPGDNSTLLGQSVFKNISLAVPGKHNIANALTVLALAEPLQVEQENFLDAVKRFRGLAHRSEFVAEQSGVRWYNDSKGTNVDACEKAIAAMPGPVILIAGGIGKGADFSVLRSIVSQCVKLLILIGRDKSLIAAELQGCADTVLSDSLSAAVDIAAQHATDGDTVLLSPACSSFDMFRNFEDRGEQFKAAVNEVMAA